MAYCVAELIGRGERLAVKILKKNLKLKELTRKAFFDQPGIYTQIAIPRLISQDYKFPVSVEQKRSSVDILVHTNNHALVAVRIQNGINQKNKIRGHTGDHKELFDIAQRNILLDNGISVVDIPEYECKELFKEKDETKAQKELMYFWDNCIKHPGARDPRF